MMYKIFTLAVAVFIIPVSQKIVGVHFSVNNNPENPAYIFPYKNTVTTNSSKLEKKTVAWHWSQYRMATAQENIRKSEYHFTWKKNKSLLLAKRK